MHVKKTNMTTKYKQLQWIRNKHAPTYYICAKFELATTKNVACHTVNRPMS